MPGTYVVTEPVTEQDLLRIANQIARKRLAKGSAITSTTEAAERLQTLLQDREHRSVWCTVPRLPTSCTGL